jgi:uncharacterized protein YndB with AHSA1/START domain
MKFKMADIIHRVGIRAPMTQVYSALSTINGLAGWWTEETTGTSEIGKVIQFRFRSPNRDLKGEMEMEVLALEPNKKVKWRCKSGPEEWIGTDLTFNLSQEGEYTLVLFGHKNWREATEFTAHCSMKWATFLLSLKALVETGKGKPAPHDVKIDNWN